MKRRRGTGGAGGWAREGGRRPAARPGWAKGLILLALGAAVGCGSRVEPSPSLDLSPGVDALFAELDEETSPGAAVMVVHDGRVVHQAGYGLADLASGEPITPATAFRLASVSKQFVAMALMILAERGELAYDDPVTRFLPELDRFGEELTIRHLLQHTGGLPEYYEEIEKRFAQGPMPTNEDAIRVMGEWGEPFFAPGERFRYSNPGYEMLASIVERATGESFAVFLSREVFEPLGMSSSRVRDATEPGIPNRAIGYSRDDEGLVVDDEHRLNYLIGAGGVYSTLEDLYRWDQALYDESLVTQATLDEAFSPPSIAGGESHPYGFGWGIGSYGALGRSLAHSGGWVGFRTYIARYPERRFTVVVLANRGDFAPRELAEEVVDLAFPSRVITGARVIDGSGGPSREADVRIEGDRIVTVGEVRPGPHDLVVDGTGRVLAPGFIDAHSHVDDEILRRRLAVAAVSQGITTVVTGQDGGSRYPLEEFFERFERRNAAVNLGSYAGHGTLRHEVMGEDFERAATPEEVAAMAELLQAELEAGALGLGTGLEYDPGIYSTTGELVALARVAAAAGGRYISHIRSEDRRFWQAIDEILAIGREAGLPVQISHLKLAMTSLHGRADELIGKLEAARAEGIEVTADLYPYTYWQSTLRVLFPDRDYDDPQAAVFAVTELALPAEMVIPTFAPEPALAGKTLAEIAASRGSDPATTLIDLVRQASEWRQALDPEERDEADVESVIAVSMRETDIERLMAWRWLGFSTDGELAGAHPRGFGAFPRVLGHYVRERRTLTLEDAVHKMSGATASWLGIADRGLIEPGRFADLVLFDLETITDRATLENPHETAGGIDRVWVNGQVVYEEGRATGRRPGRVLRRGS